MIFDILNIVFLMTGRWNMVNEEKVKLMNKMALYEEKYGKES